MTDTPLLFRWRDAVLSLSGPPATRRLVLLVLSTHADADGTSCYPSTRRLAERTGLSRRAVEEHLRLAEGEGWITRSAVGEGQGWRRMRYGFRVPDVGQDVPQVRGAGRSPPSGERGESHARRGESDDVNVGNEVPTTSSVTSPETSSVAPTGSVARESEPREKTWVDQAVEVWAKHMGGTIKHGRVGKALKSAVVEHGEGTVLAVLDHYLADHVQNGRHRYAKVESLGETFKAELDIYRSGTRNGRGIITDADPDTGEWA